MRRSTRRTSPRCCRNPRTTSECTTSRRSRTGSSRRRPTVSSSRRSDVRPLVIAHRGASGSEVENSLAAFRAAGPKGADAVELDVHATLDGALFVHHDDALDGTRRIPQLTREQARAFRLANGEPLPLLDEALQAAGTLRVFVEVKSLDPRF